MRIFTSSATYALGAVLAMGLACTAQAQTTQGAPATTGTTATGPGAPAGPTPGPAPAAASEIVVTGSRIARRDYVSESPIVTVGAAAIQSAGAPTLENALNQLPQVVASTGASNSNYSSRGSQASIDLRGLGQQRTLVLVDGRRVEPSGSDGSVDLNIIPPSLIENIEVITGGASSVYGSDAVAGVVNLKLKKHFKGVELDAQYGETTYGDGANQNVTLTMGSDFAQDRGNAYIAFDYANRDPVVQIDRSYLRGQALSTNLQSSLVNVNASNLPSQAAVNSVFSSYGINTVVPRTTSLSVNTDGTLFSPVGPVNYKGSTSSPYEIYQGTLYSIPGDTFYAQTPLTRYSLFGHANYNLSNDVSAFMDGFFTHYTAETRGFASVAGIPGTPTLTVPITNPFIPSGLASILASRPSPNAPITIQQSEVGFGVRGERNDYDVFQLTAGLHGDTHVSDITWDAYASYGRTQYQASELGYLSSSALNNLFASPSGGANLCSGGFNPFGIHAVSQSCINYVARAAGTTTTLEQRVVELNVQGKVWTLPAGDLRFAAGADYRSNSYAFSPDAEIQSGDLANFLPEFPSSGTSQVGELYGELLVPVVRDLPFIKEFNLDLGYRFSDYDTVGGVNTYKADFDWQVVSGLRLRGGYARATRAPSVGELYAAVSSGQLGLGSPGILGSGDPCDVRGAYRTPGAANAAQVRALCLAQGIPANLVDSFTNQVSRTAYSTSGNSNLTPETSDTYSIGVVLRPHFNNPFLSRISASIDYYDIRLDHAIGIVTNTVATSQCFSGAQNPTFSNSNYYCGLITRDSTGQISLIQNPELNLGGYETTGVDFALDWSLPLRDAGLSERWGTVSLSMVANYLNSFRIQTLPGGPTLEYAGTIGNTQIDQFADAHPRWKGTTTLGWQVGPVQADLRWRYLDGMENSANIGTGGTAHGVPSVSYYDLDAVWQFSKSLQLRAGIENLFNKAPPPLYSPIGLFVVDPYTYDVIGRRFTLALKAKF